MQTSEGATATVVGRELLTFTLGSEEYGIDILKVQEIRGYDAVTTIANAPEFIKGVINLRGIIVPIVDMRIKFHLGKVEYDQFTVVIILNVANRVVGIVVDGVSDVIALTPEQIKPSPEFSTTLDTQYITGLGTVDERMIIVVDIEKLLGSRDMELFETAAA
jgi:purine-binding chemotaxis protein CheW